MENEFQKRINESLLNNTKSKEELYLYLKHNYGDVSSWTIWSKPDLGHPKSNIEKLDLFEDEKIINKLNFKYVFIGLNAAKHSDSHSVVTWSNFHSCDKKRQQDYKLRYALENSKFYGSYITDVIKKYVETDSNKVWNSIKNDEDLLAKNKKMLLDEIEHFPEKPTLIAIGSKSYQILKIMLGKEYNIIKIQHYSSYVGLDEYKKNVLDALKNA